MLLYCKVIDDNTKEVVVGLGNNEEYYKSKGFTKKEVVKVNNVYYLKGYEPKEVTNKYELRIKLEEEFYKEYPLYKQCNIAIYGTEEERQKFKEFHDRLVNEYDNKLSKL